MIIRKNNIVPIIAIFCFILISIYRYFDSEMGPELRYFEALCFIFQSFVHIGTIVYWGITIYQRVMQKSIRNLLLVFCSLAIFWLFLRNIKWRAFEYLSFESRIAWYLFYIPMIFMPLCCFFIALTMGRDENYKPSKKWFILPIIATFLIAIVLTNDFHQLIFTFNPNYENWDSDYSYNFIYIFVQLFIWSIILSAAFMLFKKWRKINRTKNKYLPLIVIAVGAIYILCYILNLSIARIIIDLTTFNVFFYLLFWESCIQIGLICSNSKHKEFFKHSKVAAQILDINGKANLLSEQSSPITQSDFLYLSQKSCKTLENMIIHIAPITSGYVAWTKDISKLNAMNEELADLQDELFGEVAFLEEERKLKEKNARLKKLNNLYNLISKYIFPKINKIEALIKNVEIINDEQQDTILKQINLISCYIKRKTNLILQIDSGKMIANKDMISCYNESFRGLGLFGISCHINYNPPSDIGNNIHILYYDLFEEMLEKSGFCLEMIFVNCMEDEDNIRFSIEISNDKNICEEVFSEFKREKLKKLGGVLKVYENEDSILILLLFSKNKEEK